MSSTSRGERNVRDLVWSCSNSSALAELLHLYFFCLSVMWLSYTRLYVYDDVLEQLYIYIYIHTHTHIFILRYVCVRIPVEELAEVLEALYTSS